MLEVNIGLFEIIFSLKIAAMGRDMGAGKQLFSVN